MPPFRIARFLLVFVCAFCASSGDADRALRLKQTLMAPCCWAEPVLHHNSPAAQEMRAEIDRLVAAGASDAEIVQAFKNRYGRRILTQPDGSAGRLLSIIPFALLGLGFVWVVLILRRWSKRPAAAAPNGEAAGVEAALPEVGDLR